MKKALAVIALLVGGILAYNFFTAGQLTIIPGSSLSEEEQELKALESRFHTARSRLSQANRAAGMTGTDTTADAEAALRQVERVEKDLKEVMARLSSESARQKATGLEREIQDFKKSLR